MSTPTTDTSLVAREQQPRTVASSLHRTSDALTDTSLVAREQQPLTVASSLHRISDALRDTRIAFENFFATSPGLPLTVATVATGAFAVRGAATTVPVLDQGLLPKVTGFLGAAAATAYVALMFFRQSRKISELEELNAQLTTANAQLVTRSRGPLVQEPDEEPRRQAQPAAASSSSTEGEAEEVRADSSTRTTPAQHTPHKGLSNPPARPAPKAAAHPPMRFGK